MPQWDEEGKDDELPGNSPLLHLVLMATTLQNRFGYDGIFGEMAAHRRHGLTFLGIFFDVLPEGAEIAEVPDKAATTSNFPDARWDAERTI